MIVGQGILNEKQLEASENGTRGMTDMAFMSTTTDKSTAVHYAKNGASKSQTANVLRLQLDENSIGAGVAWLSQFPKENEVLYP